MAVHQHDELPPDGIHVPDEELRRLVSHFHRQRWAFLGLMMIIVALSIALLFALALRDEKRLSASCQFYYDVATTSLTPAPGVSRPAQLGVQIVADSRIAYEGEACPAKLPPPSPQVRRWAKFYHIPLV